MESSDKSLGTFAGIAGDADGSTVTASWLAKAVVLTALMPWRILPSVRRVHLEALVALAVAALLADLLWTVGTYIPMMPPRVQIVGMLESLAIALGSYCAVLTVCGAARGQSLRETLVHGLKYGLLLFTSLLAWGLVVGPVVRYGATSLWLWPWPYLCTLGALHVYAVVAAALSAARLARQEDVAGSWQYTDDADSVWPGCIRCEYSLRNLPSVEIWLEGKRQDDSSPILAAAAQGICPECGTAISDSLQQHDRQLQFIRQLSQGEPAAASQDGRRAGRIVSRPGLLGRWTVLPRRTRMTIAWLAGCMAVAVCLGIGCYPNDWVFLSLFHLDRVLLCSGTVSVLLGLRLWRQVGQNRMWLAGRAAVPAIWIMAAALAGLAAAAGPARTLAGWWNSMLWSYMMPEYLLGGGFLLVIQGMLLWRMNKWLLRQGPLLEQHGLQDGGDSQDGGRHRSTTGCTGKDSQPRQVRRTTGQLDAVRLARVDKMVRSASLSMAGSSWIL